MALRMLSVDLRWALCCPGQFFVLGRVFSVFLAD